jgi:RNA polymerase sigma-70 factor, ECF subfamily
VSKFSVRVGPMMTNATVLPINDSGLPSTFNQQEPICPEALRACYITHYRDVLRICRRYFRQPQDAEDAAAEVFLKLFRVLHQKDEALPFLPWLSRVAGRHCIDILRGRKHEKNLSLEGIESGAMADHDTPSPLSEILRKDEQRRVREHLTRLPEIYRVPLVLRYYKRMSYDEIARALNTRLPSVKIRIFRAKNCLRRNLRNSAGLLPASF